MGWRSVDILATKLKENTIPLLKEYHIEKIVCALECFKEHPYRREKQKECILKLYPEKTEKSVFRGMVIPTLRKTGLILGYEGFIRISANGSVAVESKKMSGSFHQRTLQALTLDIDRRKFNFIEELANIGGFEKLVSEEHFKKMLASRIVSPSHKQSIERINHWLRILEQAGLIRRNLVGEISLDLQVCNQAKADLSITGIKVAKFEEYLIGSFLELRREVGVIIDIADLREKVAIKLLNKEKEILTENQFDELLRRTLIATDKYIISLGRPMGAEEKLFSFKGKYYRTMTIEVAGGRQE
jgi:hypothetical protein